MYTPSTYKQHICRYKHNCVLYIVVNNEILLRAFERARRIKLHFTIVYLFWKGLKLTNAIFRFRQTEKCWCVCVYCRSECRVFVYSIWIQYVVPIKFTSNLNVSQFDQMCISCFTCTPSTWTDKVNNFCNLLYLCVYNIQLNTIFHKMVLICMFEFIAI